MNQWSATSASSRQLLNEEELISIADTMRVLSTSRTTVFHLLKDGLLSSVKIGNRKLVRTESIRRFIETGGTPTTTTKEEAPA